MFAEISLSDSSFVIRVINSFAAFSVNVAMKILSGLTPHSCIRNIVLCIKVYVLPVPGPAVIRTGPSEVVIASR